MIISTRKKFIFCAFNKTGSSSIQHELSKYASKYTEWRLQRQYKHIQTTVVFKHMRPLDLKRLVGDKIWESYFTFCFVRNPYDRLVSLYSYHQQTIPHVHPLASQCSFEEWLRRGGAGSANRLMSEYVCDDDGKVIMDFIGRYENLADDFQTVCQKIGIKAELPYHNISKHNHYSIYYTDATREEVQRRFQPDLEMFDYHFEQNF